MNKLSTVYYYLSVYCEMWLLLWFVVERLRFVVIVIACYLIRWLLLLSRLTGNDCWLTRSKWKLSWTDVREELALCVKYIQMAVKCIELIRRCTSENGQSYDRITYSSSVWDEIFQTTDQNVSLFCFTEIILKFLASVELEVIQCSPMTNQGLSS